MPSPVRSTWIDFVRRGLKSRDSIFSKNFYFQKFINARLSPEDTGAVVNCTTGFSVNNNIGGNPEPDASIAYSMGIVRGGDSVPVAIYGADTGVLMGEIISPNAAPATLEAPKTGTNGWDGQDLGIGDGGGVSIVPFRDYLYIFRGSGSPAHGKIDISTSAAQNHTVESIGVDRPVVTALTAALDPGGDDNVKGTVKHFIAEVSGEVEGALSSYVDSAGLNCGDGNRVTLTFNDPEFYGNTYRVYRTPANFHVPLYVGEVTIAGSAPGTTFTDDVPDALLGDPPYQHGDLPPDDIHTAIEAYGRIFGANESTLYWSDVNYPDSWWTSEFGNSLEITTNPADKICRIDRDRTSLLIFTEDAVYRLYGKIPSQFELRPLETSSGLSVGLGRWRSDQNSSASNVVHTKSGICFRNHQGIFLISSGGLTELTESVRDQLFTGELGSAFGLGYDPVLNELYATLPERAGGAEDYATFIFSFPDGMWVGTIDQPFSCFATHAGKLYGSTVDLGTPSGSEISCTVLSYYSATSTPETSFGREEGEVHFGRFFADSPMAVKRFHAITLMFEPSNNTCNMEVDVIIDGNTGDARTYTFQTHINTSPLRFPFGFVGRDLELKIRQNGTTVPWTIYGLGFEYQYLGDSSKFGKNYSSPRSGGGDGDFTPIPMPHPTF